jgi:hypothetical protein
MTRPRMSQLLTETLQDVRWAEEHLQIAERTLRNGTWFPTPEAPQTSVRLPPWAPASLFLHWPGVREQVAPRLPRFPANATRLAPPAPPRLHCVLRRRAAQSARRLLQLYAFGGEDEYATVPALQPQQLAGVPGLADLRHDLRAWSSANGTQGLAPPAAALACTDALALAVTATALLTCLLTLACVWLAAQRKRPPAPQPPKLLVDLPPVVALAPASDRV